MPSTESENSPKDPFKIKSRINMTDHMITRSEKDSFVFGIEANQPLSECTLVKVNSSGLQCTFMYSSQQRSSFPPKKTCSPGFTDNFSNRLTFDHDAGTGSFKCLLKLTDSRVSGEIFSHFSNHVKFFEIFFKIFGLQLNHEFHKNSNRGFDYSCKTAFNCEKSFFVHKPW
jgi:hypothetical protein